MSCDSSPNSLVLISSYLISASSSPSELLSERRAWPCRTTNILTQRGFLLQTGIPPSRFSLAPFPPVPAFPECPGELPALSSFSLVPFPTPSLHSWSARHALERSLPCPAFSRLLSPHPCSPAIPWEASCPAQLFPFPLYPCTPRVLIVPRAARCPSQLFPSRADNGARISRDNPSHKSRRSRCPAGPRCRALSEHTNRLFQRHSRKGNILARQAFPSYF